MKFAKKVFLGFLPMFLAVVLVVALVVSGCSFPGFVSKTEALLPVFMQGFMNIMGIVALATGNPAAIGAADKAIATGAEAAAQAALTELCGSPAPGAAQCDTGSLVGQYQAAPAASKATLLGKIDTLLSVVSQNLNAVLGIAHIFDAALQATISSGLMLLLGTLISIQNLWPAPSAPAASARASVRAALPRSVVVSKSIPSCSSFVKSMNRVLVGYPALQLR